MTMAATIFNNDYSDIFQAQSKVLPNNGGVNIKFSGALDCYRTIVKQLKVQALWHGFFPAFLRVSKNYRIKST